MNSSEQAQYQGIQQKIEAARASAVAVPAGEQTEEQKKMGLSARCNQYKSVVGEAGTQAGQISSAVCFRVHHECETTCGNLAAPYKQGAGANPEVANFLEGQKSSCAGLVAQVGVLGNSTNSMTMAGFSGENCANATTQDPMASALAQSLGGLSGLGGQAKAAELDKSTATNEGSPNDPYGCEANPGSDVCQGCQNNPNSAACRALAQVNGAEKGNAGFQDASTLKARNLNDFNLPDHSRTPPGGPTFGRHDSVAPEPVKLVPNNSGGPIPGDSNSKPASLAANGVRPQSAGSAGYSVNIDQGTRSGGGWSPPVGNNLYDTSKYNGKMGSRSGRSPASIRGGVDLKQYLPGGKMDSKWRAGGYASRNPEICSQSADVWKNISNRMREKCQLGVLLDCR